MKIATPIGENKWRIVPFHSSSDFLLAENINHQSVSLFGILDGHGGAHISEYCSQQIPIVTTALILACSKIHQSGTQARENHF